MERVNALPDPRVSVIIITRNRADFLPRSIGSVLEQTIKEIECIVVEDDSTDATPQFLDEWAGKDSRVRPIHLPEAMKGQLDVLRNIGIKAARGAYIAMLDDDDEWMPEKLEKQLAMFEADKTGKLGFVGCDAVRCKPDGSEQLRTEPHEGNVLRNLLMKNIVHNGSIALIKASALREVGMFDEKLIACENRDLWIRLSAAGYTYGYVREPLVKIYLHGTNHHYSWNTSRQKRRALDFEYMFEKKPGALAKGGPV